MPTSRTTHIDGIKEGDGVEPFYELFKIFNESIFNM